MPVGVYSGRASNDPAAWLGFDERIRGGHHIFTMAGVEEILNLQPRDGKGKPYQVHQVRNVILRYRLTLGD
jgi:hypothetical protein